MTQARREHYLEPDQFHDLSADPLEMKDLAGNPGVKTQLEKMRGLLTARLEAQGRPFGEFVPRRGFVPGAAFAPYIEKMKQLQRTKRGYEVIDDTSGKSQTSSRADRKAARDARKSRENS
jgi:hypothetical protein